MLFFTTLVSLLSLASANFLSKGGAGDPSYDSSKYHWECGIVAITNRTNCDHVFSQIRNISASTNRWWTKNDWDEKEWQHGSCKATLSVGALPSGGLKIHTGELASVVEWGTNSLCGRSSQRTMVKPLNGTWQLWLTEPAWNRSRPFTFNEFWAM
ncbi:hypothetical protein ACJ41O_010714 [Fusarium nematophilum]